MKRLVPLLALIAGLAAPVYAQKIVLKSGKTVDGQNLKRSGATVNVTVQVGASKGNIGYAISDIERIEFPEPPEIAVANDLLLSGKAAQALSRIGPVITAQTPFRDIPGNWWDRAAGIKLSALIALRLDDQIPALAADLAKYGKDPEVSRAAKVYEAKSLLKKGDSAAALAAVKSIIDESKSPETLANAWLIVGGAELARKNYREALMAYLRVPVFYPEVQIAMPSALLGAARAYEGLEDFLSAKSSLDELARSYSLSPEARESTDDLKRISRRLDNI